MTAICVIVYVCGEMFALSITEKNHAIGQSCRVWLGHVPLLVSTVMVLVNSCVQGCVRTIELFSGRGVAA